MKIFACAALLLASCGGMQTAGEQAQTPETKTAVKHGPEIALLKPDPKSGMTVNEALQNRRSWREYAPEALSLEELSGVMWAAGGINRPQDGRLTAPSALALYPIRIYAFFPEGVYRYDAKGQRTGACGGRRPPERRRGTAVRVHGAAQSGLCGRHVGL